MRHGFVLCGLLLSALTTQAGDYKYLVFETDAGPRSVSVDALEMTVQDGQLVTISGEDSECFDLATLSKMYFSSQEVTGIGSATQQTAGQVDVVNLSGCRVSLYPSIDAARQSLPKGVYVVRQDGKNLKMAVR